MNFKKEVISYTKKGRKNKTINREFAEICKLSQHELKTFLNKKLSEYYKNVIAQDGFLYAKGKDKVCLTAHMDTVHKEPVIDFYEYKKDGKHIISSPQGIGGDDRCGIYMILKILETGLRPTILFCEDEEIGCVGSSKFTRTKFIKDLKKMYFLIELDRRGGNNVVFYDDENEDWIDFVTKSTGYREEMGSFTDICELSPECGISSVNIGCGYYNAHTLDEYVILEEMENSIKTTIKLIKEGLKRKEKFIYTEMPRNKIFSNGYDWYDTDYSDWYKPTPKFLTAYISFDNGYGEKGEEEFYGETVEAIFYEFMLKHQDISVSQITEFFVYDEGYNPVTTLLDVV